MDSTPVDATKLLPGWGQFLHSSGRVTGTRKNSSKMEISRRNEKKSSTFPGNSYPKSLKCSKIYLNIFDKILNILKNLRVHRTNDSQLFRSLSPKSLSRDDPAIPCHGFLPPHFFCRRASIGSWTICSERTH